MTLAVLDSDFQLAAIDPIACPNPDQKPFVIAQKREYKRQEKQGNESGDEKPKSDRNCHGDKELGLQLFSMMSGASPKIVVREVSHIARKRETPAS